MPMKRRTSRAAAPPARSTAAPRAKRPARESTRKKKPAEPGRVITLRAMVGNRIVEAHVTRSAPLERVAEEWAYILRARQRWVDKPDVRRDLRMRALADLARVGIPRTFVQRLTSARHVEVELHHWDEGDATANRLHEAAAEVPWEYLISAGTRGVGRHRSILITRLFRNASPAIIPAPPRHVLFVESGPGRLEDEYDFASERARIRAAVGADGAGSERTMEVSDTEKVPDLKRRVRRESWEVIHVTGMDTHQASLFIPTLYDELQGSTRIWDSITDTDGRVKDGMVLREANLAERPVPYTDLASILVNPAHPPYLVSLNLYHSGARTARELVRQGANAALGFLDEIDDELAELFFQAFYWAWCRPEGAFAIPAAFVEAWKNLKEQGDRLHGTAITMWLGTSVFEEHRIVGYAAAAAPPPEQDRHARLEAQAQRPIGELLQVECEADPVINYSLLHNERPLLAKLTLTKLVKEPLEDIGILVELNLGAQSYPYRATQLVLDEPQLALAPAVRIPLTATLPRALRERVQSTVYVKVTLGGRVAYEATKRVTLIPVDEWLDDTDNNPWLPSFVLPRDPAVLSIIASSRRYLIGIRDDPAAGFDGYQSVDPELDDPSEGVDAQVRAIWTALVNEYRFQYINPPPAYSDQTQRLRTPSDILQSGTGTCIDLALLLASCLEYVDIYPVVVLLTGHAFVGYWRSEEAHDAFVEVLDVPAMVPAVGGAVAREAGVPFVDRYGWRLTRLHYEEVRAHVASGDLVFLEATYLTSASGFAEAVTEGRANLRSKREFDSLLDIKLARSAQPPVTPLPIITA